MAYEFKPGQGSAFKNENKTEDWHAAYRGKVMLPDGAMYYLDITPKKTASGDTFINVKIGKQIEAAAGAKPVAKPAVAHAAPVLEEDDSDIPF